MFTIKTVECLAGCGYAPVVQIGDHYYENLTKEKIDDLVGKLRASAPSVHERIL
jgi:NADH-quinone oxidoreductase subunit E